MGDGRKKSWRDVDRQRDGSKHKDPREADRRREEAARQNVEVRQHRQALEALFAPKKTVEEVPQAKQRIVLPAVPNADPKNAQRRRLLEKFLAATGSVQISKVADEFLGEGFTFPEEQEVYLQLLEHGSEERTVDAMEGLTRLLAGELPKRKPLLEQRLRRIEQNAEHESTRERASALRRIIQGKKGSSTGQGR